MMRDKMTCDERWKAITENDRRYDGIFFYAVKSTGIYCRPSCKSKQPRRENVCFFDTAEEAEAEHYRPCKRCQSDRLHDNPEKEIAEKIKRLLEQSFYEKGVLDVASHNLGITRHRMIERFKEEYGVTPVQYANELRLNETKRLLSETKNSVVDVAYAVGFNSLSAFYRFFKISAGKTPCAYRKEQKDK